MNPSYPGYFADPFVTRDADGTYYAYGTAPAAHQPRVFPVLSSVDLRSWQPHDNALVRPDDDLGDAFWAPEVVWAQGLWWMYYSVGRDIVGHHLRVASAVGPLGPFTDLGINLTPDELFAIDGHPFRDRDGRRYLYYARDVLEDARPGTHLAVAPLRADMTGLDGPAVPVLQPSADWQIYQRDRLMYGRTLDWHTLEGPSVVWSSGRYWLTYSAGNWTNESYRVSWAVADHPLGPWTAAPDTAPPLLATTDDLIGPGHNSIVAAPDGHHEIVFHAWDHGRTRRQMHTRPIRFSPTSPFVDHHDTRPILEGSA
ncbi:glycoside hydrolase family 43 protein [Nakamurella sp. A5-74]|uniref:Glycoside hydrolase family 43 protein n=1 Tax=Nakamurella sp. A5-74 TaxID=3158264 RepID=A0AAU8DM41_9ACTN